MDIKGIRAFAHITGGGLIENIVRTLTKGQGIEINLSNWELPLIFKWLSDTGGVNNLEMLRTFNCGIGMTIICSPSSQDKVFSVLEKMGENPFVLGQLRVVVKLNTLEILYETLCCYPYIREWVQHGAIS